MKKSKLFLSVCMSIFLLSSCSNESTEPNVLVSGSSEILEFIYKGETFKCETRKNDSTLVLLDDRANEVWKKLGQNPNYAAHLHPNGIIEYFDSKDELKSFLSSRSMTKAVTDNTITEVTVIVYHDGYYQGKHQAHVYDTSNTLEYHYDSFTGTGYNDEISSVRFRCNYTRHTSSMQAKRTVAILCLYSDIEFRGIVLTSDIRPDAGINIGDIPNLTLCPTPWGGDWNDIISSFKVICMLG